MVRPISSRKRVMMLIGMAGILMACVAQPNRSATDTAVGVAGKFEHPVLCLFQCLAGTSWYGIYNEEFKIGWGRITHEFLPRQQTLRIQKEQNIHFIVNGYTHEIAFLLDMQFETTPPFLLKRYEYVERVNDYSLRRKLNKKGETFRRTVTSTDRRWKLSDKIITYTLEDELALEALIGKNPKIGESTTIKYLNPNKLHWDTGVAKIVAIDPPHNNHQQFKIYHIEHPQMGQGATTSGYRDDLSIVNQKLISGFMLRRETKDAALAGIGQEDLYVNLMLPIDTPIGRPDAVRQVKIAVDTRTGALLTEATGQRIEKNLEENHYVVTLDAEKIFREPAVTGELEAYKEIPDPLNDDDEPLLVAARQALKGVNGLQEKIERLLIFVDESIEDSNDVLSPSLEYILAHKKGDCSEHAVVFEGLARTFGIPSRKVSGLMYMGDWSQSFGLHAWNEVYIDGYWLPVDATRRDSDLPPLYIRFPVNLHTSEELAQFVPHMKVKILEVDRSR